MRVVGDACDAIEKGFVEAARLGRLDAAPLDKERSELTPSARMRRASSAVKAGSGSSTALPSSKLTSKTPATRAFMPKSRICLPRASTSAPHFTPTGAPAKSGPMQGAGVTESDWHAT